MKKTRLTLILVSLCVLPLPLLGATANYAVGFYAGIMPSPGGDLNSYVQIAKYNSSNGIDGINKSLDGFSTSTINRPLGVTGGVEFKAIFFDYYFARVAGNYTRSVYGGKGKTVYDSDPGAPFVPELLTAKYAITAYDIPITVGLCIPFWKDVKISFSCGFAVAYGDYTNSFKSTSNTDKGSFSGWCYPLVLMLQGEYFLTETVSLSSSLSYYRGSTEILKDSKKSDTVDFAKIDFSGYRINFGMAYYFYSI